MRQLLFAVLVGLMVVAECATGARVAEAMGWREFSADMVSTAANGQVFTGKIYVSEEKTRMEMQESVVISRIDKRVSWILMPAQRMYMEHPIDPSTIGKVAGEVTGEIERTPMGTESVDGRSARKFKVTYVYDGRQESMYQWLGDSDIPLKVEALDGSWRLEYRNLRVESQPDSLFEIPPGYTKFEMPGLPKNWQAMAEGN